MKKILVFFTVLFAVTTAYSAVNVNVNFTNQDLQDHISSIIAADVATELDNYSNMPKLARGFANSNTYASGAANMRGYQGYDLFAVSVGTMFSVQAPSSDPAFYEDLQDQLDEGDVYAGMGAGFDYVAGGSTKLSLKSAGDVEITGSSGLINGADVDGEKGTISIDTSSKADADQFRAKLMANVGLSLGPVYIDMPATIYIDNGYAIGLSAGIVW